MRQVMEKVVQLGEVAADLGYLFNHADRQRTSAQLALPHSTAENLIPALPPRLPDRCPVR